MLDEHSLDDEQIVVQTDHRVDQSNEHSGIGQCTNRGGDLSAIGCSHEHEELGEHTCKRRNTTEREQGQRHDETQTGIGLVEAIISIHTDHTAIVLLDGGDDGEDSQVGYNINEHVVAQSRHAHCGITNHSQHDVTGL